MNVGRVERAADRTLAAGVLLGLLNEDADALACELVRTAARAVDAAGDDAGRLGYAVAVLSKCMTLAGVDPKQTGRVLATGVDTRHLAALLDKRAPASA